MMTKYEIIPAKREHAQILAGDMRDADVAELWDGLRLRPLDAVEHSLKVSRDPKTGLADGRVVVMFGVAQLSQLSRTGYPWLLSAKDINKHAKQFLRQTQHFLGEMRQEFSLLENYVDARNRQAIRWMRWMGFEIHPPTPFGIDQLPFHRFTMEGKQWPLFQQP
jgi:hypothetical protein